MTQWRNAPGLIDPPIVYFEAPRDFQIGMKFVRKGFCIVAPDSKHPTPYGYERKECKYLHEVDALTKRMNVQDKEQYECLVAKDQEIMRQRREKTRTTLRQRMLAVDCTPFEKRFIEGALAYLDRKEKETTEFKIRGYFVQREMDSAHAHTDDYGRQLVMPRMSDRLSSLLTK